MKKYCVDTSGLSNPLEQLPPDIFGSIWDNIETLISDGAFAATVEIYEEQVLIPNPLGKIIKENKSQIILEIGDESWEWRTYVETSNYLNEQYHPFISEYSGGSPKTVGLNDMSIIALAKSLALPVVSMESNALNSANKKRIPDICDLENIPHMTFNDLLRAEDISI